MARNKRDAWQVDAGYSINNSRSQILGYKSYYAQLTQSGSNDPVVTEIVNDLSGSVSWVRASSGSFLGTLSGAFPVTKTFFNAPESSSVNITFGTSISSSGNTVVLQKYSASVAQDGINAFPVDIKVFIV